MIEPSPQRSSKERARARQRMVVDQLRRRDIHDERVLRAMADTPREAFVPEGERSRAYADNALPIGQGQTISQPYMVARATELACLLPDDVVLEVGLGSGYQAAVLAQLAKRVVALELLPELAARARNTLEALQIENVDVHVGDGSRGYAPAAPFDAIVVSAAAQHVPSMLIQQLAVGGRLVIPVGEPDRQVLTRIERTRDGLNTTHHDVCVYVPLRQAPEP